MIARSRTETLLPLSQIPMALAELQEQVRVLEIENRRLLQANAALELANGDLHKRVDDAESAFHAAEGGRRTAENVLRNQQQRHDDLLHAAKFYCDDDTFLGMFCVSCDDAPQADFTTELCRECGIAGEPS